MKIKDVSILVNEKNNDVFNFNKYNYISTENMLPEFGGVLPANSFTIEKVKIFRDGDILISNIRPYFKKIWFSKFDGGCSNDVLILRVNNKIINKFLFYYFNTEKFINYYVLSCKGTKMPRGDIDSLLNHEFEVPKFESQQHIVDTIGSVDDLIENLARQNDFLFEFGLNKINDFNKKSKLDLLKNIAEFHKGVEIGSSKYKETHDSNLIQYIRVSDLTAKGNTYVQFEKQLKIANFDDILLALDGAPGRNNIGYSGAYSSGIYKVQVDTINRGLTYFEINSNINKEIISNHSQGTTILHASKSINYLVYAVITNDDKEILNNLFDRILFNKRKIEYLSSIKRVLLNKYFR